MGFTPGNGQVIDPAAAHFLCGDAYAPVTYLRKPNRSYKSLRPPEISH
jgi:hypothetical protein